LKTPKLLEKIMGTPAPSLDDVIEAARVAQEAKQNALKAEYAALVKAQASGQPLDAARLAEVMTALDKPAEQLGDDVAVMRRWLELEAEHASFLENQPALEADYIAKRDAEAAAKNSIPSLHAATVAANQTLSHRRAVIINRRVFYGANVELLEHSDMAEDLKCRA
jgi:hypothetical protein